MAESVFNAFIFRFVFISRLIIAPRTLAEWILHVQKLNSCLAWAVHVLLFKLASTVFFFSASVRLRV